MIVAVSLPKDQFQSLISRDVNSIRNFEEMATKLESACVLLPGIFGVEDKP